MKKALDKLNLDKKKITFLLCLLLIGVITGTILFVFLNKTDYNLVKEQLTNYFNSLNSLNLNKYLLNSLISNIFLIIFIWLLGISIVGIPFVIIIYFIKSFIIGFTISSMIAVFGVKGVIIAIIYLLFQLILMLILTLLTMYSLNLSFKILKTIIKKSTMDFRIIMTRYIKVLVMAIVLITVYTLLDNYLLPTLLKIVV